MINAAFDEPQVRAIDVSFGLWTRETLEDRAIFATDGSLESDCAAFRRPDQGHRVSPWFRLPLKLHSVESARTSYNTWAASERGPQPRRTAHLRARRERPEA